MRLDVPSLRPASVTGTAPTLLAQWRVGTVLQAVTVVDASGRLFLDIGDSRFSARLASREMNMPRNGERLQLRVLRDSPVLAFETVPQPSIEEAANPTLEALRRYVPRQNSAAPLAANLAFVVKGPRSNLPSAVTQAAALVWEAMPDAETLEDPQGLRQAIVDSGAFLEAKLADAPTRSTGESIANDLKALLLQFGRVLKEQGARAAAAPPATTPAAPVPTANGALRTLPGAAPTLMTLGPPEQQLHELAHQTEGAIARLTTLQLANSAPDPMAQALLVELPVRREDEVHMLRLRIEHEDPSRRGGGSRSSWTVEAALDLGEAGGLHARVHLQDQRIDVQLRAASAEVVNALTARRGELEAILREAGLDVQRVTCLHGLPVADPDNRPPRLLDLHV